MQPVIRNSLSLILATVLAACEVGPDFVPPAAPTVNRYTTTEMSHTLTAGTNGTTQRLHSGQAVTRDWWTLFRSDRLRDVVARAVANNQTLASAHATLAAAQQAIRQTEGGLYPQVDANAKFQRGKAAASGQTSNLYSVGPNASYALDIFGGTRRAVERQKALADNQLYQLGAAYLTLTGTVVTQSLTAASLRTQLAAFEDIVSDDEENVRLVREKLESGKAAVIDILAAESQLANDRTQLPPLRQQISVADHAISVLVGEFPGAWAPPKFQLDDFQLPADLPVTLPSQLVHQRPDILSAEAQLRADSANIGVATAQMYPNITLTSSSVFQSRSTDALFSGSNLLWNLASGLTAPIFHGNALEAQRAQAVDAFEASAATYRQTVLQAFGQVADTLSALEHDAETLAAQRQALDTANAALALQRISYSEGKSDLLQLLNATRSNQQARLGYIRAQGQNYQDTAQLFLTMGGGWWAARGTISGRQPPK